MAAQERAGFGQTGQAAGPAPGEGDERSAGVGEGGSIVITSNLPFDEWTEVFGSERLTGAILDRLTHHAHILELNGDSYRLRQSRQLQS